ncbi:MAG: 30S ribosomal protein S8e [Nanoarchaeota archaeon]|nr:30S ribosomal protein S8e [Nanoarchaeota archaeon]MBU1704152.1 30S ribosomal protein S8e [Nanoarchaeota archaeon]
MVILQKRANRKPTGGRYKSSKTKPMHEMGRLPALTKVEEKTRKKDIRLLGGHTKEKVLATNVINLYDPKSKKYSKATIKTVVGNPANRHYVRRNIITKGSIVETDKGKARVTSRPGQEGSISGILV